MQEGAAAASSWFWRICCCWSRRYCLAVAADPHVCGTELILSGSVCLPSLLPQHLRGLLHSHLLGRRAALTPDTPSSPRPDRPSALPGRLLRFLSDRCHCWPSFILPRTLAFPSFNTGGNSPPRPLSASPPASRPPIARTAPSRPVSSRLVSCHGRHIQLEARRL